MDGFQSLEVIDQEKAAIEAQRQAVLAKAKREYERKLQKDESVRKRKERTGEVSPCEHGRGHAHCTQRLCRLRHVDWVAGWWGCC